MTSMSGSFQWPGDACLEIPTCRKPMPAMLSQVSVMSPVVRHEFPSIPFSAPHSQTFPHPYWQSE